MKFHSIITFNSISMKIISNFEKWFNSLLYLYKRKILLFNYV